MNSSQRQMFLKIAAAGVVGLFLLDRVVVGPAVVAWHEQSDRIDALRQKVDRGNRLIEREDAIRTRWAEMVRGNLPKEVSAAESLAFKAIGRWERDSGVAFTNVAPQWQT